MSTDVVDRSCVVHSLPGRVRVRIPGWSGASTRSIEAGLREADGITRARANGTTRNILVDFEPQTITQSEVLAHVARVASETRGDTPKTDEPDLPSAVTESVGEGRHARIAVRGLDQDPRLASRLTSRLQALSGVTHAIADPLTSRVEVTFDDAETSLDALVAEVARFEASGAAEEAPPDHPLDPVPLVRSASRTIGAAVGLGVIGLRRLAGAGAPGGGGAVVAASAISIAESFPASRNAVRSAVGETGAEVVFGGAGVVALTLSGGPLGLVLAASTGLRTATELWGRREGFKRYEAARGEIGDARPGARISLEAGDRAPLAGTVVSGSGTAIERDGLPVAIGPSQTVTAGARVDGGPLELELRGDEPFVAEQRPVPAALTAPERYLQLFTRLSLVYAGATMLATGSVARGFAALMVVNPKAMTTGTAAADSGARARAERSGATVLATRRDRPLRLPDALVFDSPRLITEGLRLSEVVAFDDQFDSSRALSVASSVAGSAAAPWAGGFPAASGQAGSDAAFEHGAASATVDGARYRLEPLLDRGLLGGRAHHDRPGAFVLSLQREGDSGPCAAFILHPAVAPGVRELIATCRSRGVDVELLAHGNRQGAQSLADQLQIPLRFDQNSVEAIRARQAHGERVAFVSDSAHGAPAFAASDLAIGICDSEGIFPARADLLAPDMSTVGTLIETAYLRDVSVRDSALVACGTGLVGGWWAATRAPTVRAAFTVSSIPALAALAVTYLRLRGGSRPRATLMRLADPRPERWGRMSAASVARAFASTENGLTSDQAQARAHIGPRRESTSGLGTALMANLRSPATVVLGAGAALSLVLGSTADVVMVGAVIVANACVEAWQERRANEASEALEQLGTATARLLRDGKAVVVSKQEVVCGDVLLLAPGDHVTADARLLSADGLEIDEAALTGESLPVAKAADGLTDESRVIMEGSDVTVGTGRALVVAVGRDTRMGSIAEALAIDGSSQSPLAAHLGRMLWQGLPLVAAAGAIVTGSGLLWGRPLVSQVTIGASIAVAAVPEGLPLLARVAEAGVARRLARRQALVRRLPVVEALGRVDVACADKTGTLTQGRLELSVVSDGDSQADVSTGLTRSLRYVLETAAIASPHPDAVEAFSHPTDIAILRGVEAAGLRESARVNRVTEWPFEPARAFHATLTDERLCVKGATESIAERCTRIRRGGKEFALDGDLRRGLLATGQRLAEQGKRVLMIAEGSPEADPIDPQDLVALGFVGISDPLRPGVGEAVARSQAAGVRVIMLTGDHPATAQAIAAQAGLSTNGELDILTGPEVAELDEPELDRRLESAAVVARITPVDKVRIVESLQRRGHAVAMTGDGVNDAPALRLADVGVAMGRGTEVARQASDVVLADDDFSTLVEALVEGRGFSKNLRGALSLLLGGNLGEIGLMVGAGLFGMPSPLTARQILMVNLVTDVLPATAVAIQPPEHRDLSGLSRETAVGLDGRMRQDIVNRGIATAVPALGTYALALPFGLAQARSAAFASVVGTQLALTLDAGRGDGGLSRQVTGAVAATAALTAGALTATPIRGFFGFGPLSPALWLVAVASAVAAFGLARVLAVMRGEQSPVLPTRAASVATAARG